MTIFQKRRAKQAKRYDPYNEAHVAAGLEPPEDPRPASKRNDYIDSPIGPDYQNDPADIVTASRGLSVTGHLPFDDPAVTEGAYTAGLDKAIRTVQAEEHKINKDFKVDGEYSVKTQAVQHRNLRKAGTKLALGEPVALPKAKPAQTEPKPAAKPQTEPDRFPNLLAQATDADQKSKVATDDPKDETELSDPLQLGASGQADQNAPSQADEERSGGHDPEGEGVHLEEQRELDMQTQSETPITKLSPFSLLPELDDVPSNDDEKDEFLNDRALAIGKELNLTDKQIVIVENDLQRALAPVGPTHVARKRLMERLKGWSPEYFTNYREMVDGKPVLRMPEERRKSILENTPAIFAYTPNADADSSSPSWEIPEKGSAAVAKYDSLIEKHAGKHGVDPDIIRAIMYMENARGHWIGLNALADRIGYSDSIMPMNINPKMWGQLLGDDADLNDPDQNIEAATILLRRISGRLEDPTPTAVASIWNYLGRETPFDLGAYVERIHRERPWAVKEEE